MGWRSLKVEIGVGRNGVIDWLMSEIFEFGCLSRDYKSSRQSVEDSVIALIRPYIDREH